MSTATYSSGKPAASTDRWLWTAVGVLGVTTAALGVALVQMRNPPSAPALAAPLALTASPPQLASAASSPPSSAPTSVQSSAPSVALHANALPPTDAIHKAPVAPVKYQHAASKKIATMSPPTSPAPEPVPTQPPPPVASSRRAICATCATVVAVTPVQHDGQGSGAGVAAGAVLGGLLGNQVGGGDGKTIATVLGAVGGGWAGNTVEKRMKKVTVYQIDLRMDDGSTQRMEHASPLSVGSHVSINGGRIQL